MKTYFSVFWERKEKFIEKKKHSFINKMTKIPFSFVHIPWNLQILHF